MLAFPADGRFDLAALRARELADHLITLTETADLKIVEGDRVIEVRPTIVNKATGCEPFLVQGHDFVLALGNAADEELFRALPEGAHAVGVGNGRSLARFTVPSPAEARGLLESLAASG